VRRNADSWPVYRHSAVSSVTHAFLESEKERKSEREREREREGRGCLSLSLSLAEQGKLISAPPAHVPLFACMSYRGLEEREQTSLGSSRDAFLGNDRPVIGSPIGEKRYFVSPPLKTMPSDRSFRDCSGSSFALSISGDCSGYYENTSLFSTRDSAQRPALSNAPRERCFTMLCRSEYRGRVIPR